MAITSCIIEYSKEILLLFEKRNKIEINVIYSFLWRMIMYLLTTTYA